MTERERLIEMIDKALDKHESTIENYVHPEQEWIADYLLTNGVIVLPCKVGDIVYLVGRNNGKPIGVIDELEIMEIGKTKQGFTAKAKFKDSENVFVILDFNIDNYGFFSTREEAEKALAERNDENT